MKNISYHQHLIGLAVMLLLAGLILKYWIAKRRFNRRNVAGLPQFKSYRLALSIMAGEKIMSWLATWMIMAAIILYFLI